MHVIVNQKLARDRVRLASGFHFVALGVFAIGLWISWTQPEQILGSYTAIVVGLLLYNFGQIFLRRWGPRFRQDRLLADALKGLDNRYVLLAFTSSKLPDYILAGPGGLQVIVPRIHAGAITCRGDRWRREQGRGLGRFLTFLGGVPLGDPSQDVARGIQVVRERLQARGSPAGSEPPISGLVVFTNPEAKLRIDGCTHPVTKLRQLRNHIRGIKGTLNQQAVNRLVEALRG